MDLEEYEMSTVFQSAKRCGLDWAPWMGDWFVSSSPRNGNSHAEGQWYHWMHLAAEILSHPMSEKIAPEFYRPDLKDFADLHVYTETTGPELTVEEIATLLGKAEKW